MYISVLQYIKSKIEALIFYFKHKTEVDLRMVNGAVIIYNNVKYGGISSILHLLLSVQHCYIFEYIAIRWEIFKNSHIRHILFPASVKLNLQTHNLQKH